MVGLEPARWRLGTIWFSGGGIIFLLLVIQSLTGVYENRVQGVWAWALPNFLPTLMLMMGVFAGSALATEAETDKMSVRKPFLNLALGLSIFHLFCVLLTLLLYPLIPRLQGGPLTNPMAPFETSNLWLGPLQGLVGAAIGALFFSKTSQSAKSDATPPATMPGS